jgi:hypothetical protein
LEILSRTYTIFNQQKTAYHTSYINSSSIQNKTSTLHTTQKKKQVSNDFAISNKIISKTSMKEKTPKKRKTVH